MFFILAILIIIGLVSFELFFNRRLKECAKRLPGLPLLPILGNAHQLGRNPVENLEVSLKLGSLGNMTRLLIGPYLFVTLTGGAEVEFVATNTKLNDKSHDYQFLQSWLGDGLLLSGGDKWRKRRKLITPSFHFNVLRQYISIFEKEADIMVKKFEVAPAVFDVYPLVTLCTLDVIGETAMGVKLNSQSNPTSEYVTSVTEASLAVFKRLSNLFARFEVLYKLTPTYRKYQQHLKILHNFTNRIIKERREVLEKTNFKGEPFDVNDESIGIKKRFSFLDTLLLSETSDGSKLSDEDIREEVDTFMFEGHDTTASAISFLLYSLAQNKDVQGKVYQEQVDIFGDDFERDITYEDLNNMKYAEMTIKECLRLYPSVPLIMRKIPRDLNLNGTDIPAGAQLTINIFAMNRKPEVFEDPLNFNPERFSQENISKRHPFSYIPFSAGARNCIGQRFAMLQIKTVLSKCVRKFVLSLGNNEPLQVGSALVLKSYNGIHLSVKKRILHNQIIEVLYKLTPTYRKYQQHLKILHNFTNRIIKERREVLEKTNFKGEPFDVNDESIGIKKRFSFLDTLLLSETSDGSKLSDEDIREEVDTFMFEGHDTTASAISFLLYSLAQNKDVQGKVYQEQVDIFGDDFERDITYEDLNNMKYAEMTIKECLRLYPSVPLIMRKIPRDLNLNGTDIPAGAQLTINIFAMNRKPEVFEDPLNFNPERFSQENISKRHPFSYIPFSAGARNCIGQRFAMLQIKTVLSKCVRKFVLSLGNNEPLQVGSALVLKSYNGIHLSVKKRQ